MIEHCAICGRPIDRFADINWYQQLGRTYCATCPSTEEHFTCPMCAYQTADSRGRTCPDCGYRGDWAQPYTVEEIEPEEITLEDC